MEVTEDFVDEIFKSCVVNAMQIMTLTAQADRQFTAPPNAKPVEMGLDFEIRALPARSPTTRAPSACSRAIAKHGWRSTCSNRRVMMVS